MVELQFKEILIPFSVVIDELGRATPGAETKHKLINFLITQEVEMIPGVEKVTISGKSLLLAGNLDPAKARKMQIQLEAIRDRNIAEVLSA